MSLVLGPASLPWRGLRGTDSYGSGVFGAARDNGSRPHCGRDYIAIPGDAAVSPIDGKVTHIGLAYADADYGSVRIAGRGAEVRLLYVKPDIAEGQAVKLGQRIGTVQDIGTRYPGITSHVHVEVWIASNPELYIQGPK